MATEDILIRYRADVSQLESDLNKLIDSQEQLTAATKQNTAEQTKAANSAEFAAKKRAQLLDQETKKLQQLKEAQKLAFDPAQIEKYNNQIAASQKRIELLGGSYQQAAQQAQNSNQQILGGLNRIAGAFGIAFSAEALIQFSQKAINAFLAAEETANKLRFAVVNIGGEGEEALARLNAQAELLAEQTFFGDDDIKNAQAALSAFGLTTDQIEQAIPALLDYAAVTGEDLTSAVNAVGGALEGRAGQFKKFGVEVDANATKAENLGKVLEGLSTQAGAAGDALNTAAGKAKDNADALGELTEAIGGGLVGYLTEIGNFFKEFFGPVIENVKQLATAFANLIPDGVIAKIQEFTGGTSALGVAIRILNTPLIVLGKLLEGITFAYIKLVPVIGGLVSVVKAGFLEVRDLAVALGSSVADIFTGITDFDPAKIKSGLGKLKTGFQNIGFDVAKSFTEGYEKGQALFKDSNKAINDEIKKTVEVTLGSDELQKKSKKELNDLQAKYAKDQSNLGKQNLDAIEKEIKRRADLAKAGASAAEAAKKSAEEYAKFVQSLDSEIAKVQADLEKRKIEVIPVDSQKAQVERIQALADLNEKAITEEIAAKIKAVQDDAKLSEKQKQEVIKKYEELKQARLDLAQFNEQNELNIISKQQADRIEAAYAQIDALDLEKALTIQSDKVEAANEAVAKSFEDLSTAVSKKDFEAAKEAATLRTKQLNEEIQNEQNLNVTRIENARDAELAKVKAGEAGDAERAAINKKYQNQIDETNADTNKKIAKNNETLTTTIEEQEKASYDRRVELAFQYAQAAQQVFSEISNLFTQLTDNQIEQANKEKEARLANIDEVEARQQEALENGEISERQFKELQDANRNERLKAEEEADKRIRELKKKQAILDKANAIFEIGLSTAQNIVKQPGPAGALIPFWVALGALQAAAVLAQPVAYAQGTKDSGKEGQMARVGEHGEEMVWMPAGSKVLPNRQTRKYADVIDAMYDNRLDDFIHKNYITPALIAQKQAKENQQSKSFAQNMADSIVYNQSGLTASDLEAQRKRGQYIRNVDEIAIAIAKRLPSSNIYRN